MRDLRPSGGSTGVLRDVRTVVLALVVGLGSAVSAPVPAGGAAGSGAHLDAFVTDSGASTHCEQPAGSDECVPCPACSALVGPVATVAFSPPAPHSCAPRARPDEFLRPPELPPPRPA